MRPAIKRFLFASIGSYGDLHPVLGIALALKDRGHHVTVATVGVYKEKIERTGLYFIELAPSLEQLGLESDWYPQAMHPYWGARFVLKTVGLGFVKENFARLEAEAQKADVLIGQAVTFFVPVLAEKFRKPWVSFVLQPALFFSRFDPPSLAGLGWLRKLIIKSNLVYTGFRSFMRLATRGWWAPLRELREEQGLRGEGDHPMLEGQISPHLTLALFSKVFAPPQRDWPTHVEQPGFAFYDSDQSAEISPALEKFLGEGPPPLVFTLGTAAVMVAQDFYLVAQAAAHALNQRAVLLVGRDARNLEGLKSDELIHVTEYEPFSKLFPRASVIIHQGGVGTTAQGLRAGVPQIIHPFSHDQPDNAEHAARLGVALEWPKRSRRLETLTSLIRTIQGDGRFARCAQEVAAELAHEDAINTVADRLETLAGS